MSCLCLDHSHCTPESGLSCDELWLVHRRNFYFLLSFSLSSTALADGLKKEPVWHMVFCDKVLLGFYCCCRCCCDRVQRASCCEVFTSSYIHRITDSPLNRLTY
jgi:hypothetical protein